MPEPRFDPGGFYEFNLAQGAVHTRLGSRVLVLSDNVAAPLVAAAVKSGNLAALNELGAELGNHVRESLGGSPADASPQTVLGHAASVLSLFGWGRLGLEQWGAALVATLAQPPELDAEQRAVAAVLSGLFSSLTGRDTACVPVAAGQFLVVDPSIAAQVETWVGQGRDLPAIVGGLRGEPS